MDNFTTAIVIKKGREVRKIKISIMQPAYLWMFQICRLWPIWLFYAYFESVSLFTEFKQKKMAVKVETFSLSNQCLHFSTNPFTVIIAVTDLVDKDL